jgi:cephalosporin hydroxylase
MVRALDQQIALDYVKFLSEGEQADTPEARKAFSEKSGVDPMLLYYNPHIRAISSLFSQRSSLERLQDMTLYDYMQYHFFYVHQGYRYSGAKDLQQRWLGHDIIKLPSDCWVYQEIIYDTKPDVILELGVMFGGASHFFASILDLVGHGEVIGVDVTLDKVKEITNPRISMIEGSSTSQETFEKIKSRVQGKKVMVISDSDHEKIHVLNEIRLYNQFVPVGGYYVVEDSANDPMKYHPVPNEGPQAAAYDFLRENDSFVPDIRYAEKYILSINPYGYLKRVK